VILQFLQWNLKSLGVSLAWKSCGMHPRLPVTQLQGKTSMLECINFQLMSVIENMSVLEHSIKDLTEIRNYA